MQQHNGCGRVSPPRPALRAGGGGCPGRGPENAGVTGDRSGGAARVLARLAIGSYGASCLLGIAVASRSLRLGRARWLHHALYVVTATTATAAASSALWTRSVPGAALLPALVPLALVPYRS